jgi:hypothetical protein
VSWRAVGCGTLAAGVFVAVGLFAILRAEPPPGCPTELAFTDVGTYEPVGSPSDAPRIEGLNASPVAGFQTRAGLSTFTVWVDPADAPAASSDPLPERIALECGDGTFQAYRRADG